MDFPLRSCCGVFSLKSGVFWSICTVAGAALSALPISQTPLFVLGISTPQFDPNFRTWQVFAGVSLLITVCASISGLYATFKGQRDYLWGPLIVYPCAFIIILICAYKAVNGYDKSEWSRSNIPHMILFSYIVVEIFLAHTILILYSYYKRFS